MVLLEITQHTHVIWGNVFFYVFVLAMLCFVGMLVALLKVLKKKSADLKLLQQQHIARIDNVRKEHSNNLENLRIEMLKREEERVRQWQESEKETLRVLNGVSNLLDLTDKIGRVDSEKILKKLGEIQTKVEKLKAT
jgi:gas vesicle protein